MEKDLVTIQDNKAVTTSLQVAELFNKRHDNILRDIDTLLQGLPKNEDTPQMFEKTTYIHEQNGQEYPMYIMNRDGFTLLAMGFTGKKAMQFKIAYINAFNAMEQHIKESQPKLSQAQLLLQSAQMLVDIENRQAQVEARLDKLDEERKQATHNLLTAPYLMSKEEVPEMSERNMCRRMVNDFSKATGISQQDVWHDVYAKLYYTYGISLNSYAKQQGEKSMLDVAQRVGAMPKIHAIISSMVYTYQKNNPQ